MTEQEQKVESSTVSLKFPIKLGTPSLLTCRQGPDLNFRGRTLKSNAPASGFAFAMSLKAGNLEMLYGGSTDVSSWNGKMELDIPTISPGNSFVFEGNYTGAVPEGMKTGDEFELEIAIEGVGTLGWLVDDSEEERPRLAPKEIGHGARYLERLRKLEPNHDSDIKIEEYAFGMEFEIVLGRKCRLEGRVSPDVAFRISSVIANVPCPSFARVSDLRVANLTAVGVGGPVGSHVLSLIERPLEKAEMVKIEPAHVEGLPTVTCKSGAIDLWNFAGESGKKIIDLPTLTPANSVGFFGYYDGKVPVGYEKGEVFRLSIMFAGCASIVA
jgi:hypothetical protein